LDHSTAPILPLDANANRAVRRGASDHARKDAVGCGAAQRVAVGDPAGTGEDVERPGDGPGAGRPSGGHEENRVGARRAEDGGLAAGTGLRADRAAVQRDQVGPVRPAARRPSVRRRPAGASTGRESSAKMFCGRAAAGLAPARAAGRTAGEEVGVIFGGGPGGGRTWGGTRVVCGSGPPGTRGVGGRDAPGGDGSQTGWVGAGRGAGRGAGGIICFGSGTLGRSGAKGRGGGGAAPPAFTAVGPVSPVASTPGL